MCVDTTFARAASNREKWSNEFYFSPSVPEARDSGSLFVDVNSAARNGVSAAMTRIALPAVAGTLVAASAAAGGVLGIPIGLSHAADGFKKLKASYSVGDWEGVAAGTAWSLVGSTYAGLSSLLATDGIMTLANQSVPQALTPAFGYLGIAFYSVLLGYGAYGVLQTTSFRKELKEQIANGTAAHWLKSQLTLAGEENNLPEEEKEKLLQKKWNEFEFRAGKSSGKLLREKIQDLDDPTKVEELFLKVEEGSFKESVKHWLFVLLALLGIVASVAVFTLAPTSLISPLFFAVGAVVWIGVDSPRLHIYLGDKFWKWHKGIT